MLDFIDSVLQAMKSGFPFVKISKSAREVVEQPWIVLMPPHCSHAGVSGRLS